MDELRDDPDYELRWPHDMLVAELDALIARALEDGSDQQWREEVDTLLRQAFASPVPQREFSEQWDASSRRVIYDEEPF